MIAKHTACRRLPQYSRDIASLAIWLFLSLGVTCTPAFASPVQRENAHSPEEKRPASTQATANGQVEILSETAGVDFGPYLQRMLYGVKKNWYTQIPDSARAPQLKNGKVVVKFVILKNGALNGLTIDSSPGDPDLDRAALAGMRLSNPLDPLPAEFSGGYLSLRISFLYNLPLPARTDRTNESMTTPLPNPPPSFRVPIGIDLTKSLPVNPETDNDSSSSVTGVEILSPKDFKSYDLEMFLEQRLLRKIRQHWN